MSKTVCNNNNNNNNNSNNCILIIIFTGNSLQSIQSKLPKLSWHSGNSRGSTTRCAHGCLMSVSYLLFFYCVDSVRWVRRWELFLETFQWSLWGVWWGQRSVLVTLAAQAEALLRLQVEAENIRAAKPTRGFNSSSLESSKRPAACEADEARGCRTHETHTLAALWTGCTQGDCE